ncbi:hypothetical protein Nepgr_022803 [Nepenthes gracilis]|uniref:Uncharacterized protein n=1 Tax=Nepenthes gracilis TaxID=150966 RepID=A0AAD3T394_NEPGR|nr:hypothetical protein Nepgr_022803 [Nepenthes gracilis]
MVHHQHRPTTRSLSKGRDELTSTNPQQLPTAPIVLPTGSRCSNKLATSTNSSPGDFKTSRRPPPTQKDKFQPPGSSLQHPLVSSSNNYMHQHEKHGFNCWAIQAHSKPLGIITAHTTAIKQQYSISHPKPELSCFSTPIMAAEPRQTSGSKRQIHSNISNCNGAYWSSTIHSQLPTRESLLASIQSRGNASGVHSFNYSLNKEAARTNYHFSIRIATYYASPNTIRPDTHTKGISDGNVGHISNLNHTIPTQGAQEAATISATNTMLPLRQSQHTIQTHFSSAISSDAKFIAIPRLLNNWIPISRARGQFTHGNQQSPTDQLKHLQRHQRRH